MVLVVIDHDDPDGIFVDEQGDRHLAVRGFTQRAIARVGGHILDEHGLAVQCSPTGESLAHLKSRDGSIGRVSALRFTFEQTRIGIQEKKIAVLCLQRVESGCQGLLRGVGMQFTGGQRGDTIKGGIGVGWE